MTPAELKAKWIEELRSGRYRQTQNVLVRGETLCCLGLLCVVMGAWPTDPMLFPNAFTEAPPISQKVKSKLIAMNDYQGKSFLEIANWIETHDLQTGEPLGRD